MMHAALGMMRNLQCCAGTLSTRKSARIAVLNAVLLHNGGIVLLHGIDAARQSLRQHRWQEALAGFDESDRASPLGPDDLVQFAAAAWWSGDPDTATDTLERAFSAFELADRKA